LSDIRRIRQQEMLINSKRELRYVSIRELAKCAGVCAETVNHNVKLLETLMKKHG